MIGTIIYEYRIRRRITLRNFADLVGVSPEYISRLESGYLKPSEKIRTRLVEIFNMPKNEEESFLKVLRNSQTVNKLMCKDNLDDINKSKSSQISIALRKSN